MLMTVTMRVVETVTISELAERVRRATDSRSPVKYVPYGEAYGPGFEDMQRRIPDITRIQELTGWYPTISLDETIAAVRDQMRAEPDAD